MKKLIVKEVFLTLQGEGTYSGRLAVFCRFSGCNLWTGKESDRSKSLCDFCDTDFVGTDGVNGGRYTAKELASLIDSLWGDKPGQKFVVLTGGEPMLQVTEEFIEELHLRWFYIAIETNGTISVPASIDHICVSPKTKDFVQRHGDELKLVYPNDKISLDSVIDLNFRNHYLQPKDGMSIEQNTQLAIAQCLNDGRWQLSTQTHKLLGIP